MCHSVNRDSLFAEMLRADRKAQTRRQILAAAREVVTEEGWAGANVVDVARRAGVANGSLYRHFPSKAELCAEVFREVAGHEVEHLRAVLSGHGAPAERLARGVEEFVARARAVPTLAYALMAEPVDPVVERARIDNKAAYRAVFAELLEEGARTGAWPDLDAPVAAAALVGALQEALTVGEAGLDALVTFVLNAVGAHR